MRTHWLIGAAILSAAAWASAAEIDAQGIAYNGAELTAVTAEGVTFKSATGQPVFLRYEQISRIALGGPGDEEAFDLAELLFSHGKHKEAAAAYRTLENSSHQTVKALVKYRLPQASAMEAKTAPPTTGPDGPKPAANCSTCFGRGIVPCTACKDTGKARCPVCAARNLIGRLPCPLCEGNWNGEKCPTCKGAGRIVTGSKSDGIFVTPVTKECWRCLGKGRIKVCPRCSGESMPLRGTVVCDNCGGPGRIGPCPACGGSKRMACPKCMAGVARPGAADPPASANPPAPVSPAAKKVDAVDLTSVKELLFVLPDEILSPEITPLQAQMLADQVKTRVIGKTLRMAAEVETILPRDREVQAYLVCRVQAPRRNLYLRISVVFPADVKDRLAVVNRRWLLRFQGKITSLVASIPGYLNMTLAEPQLLSILPRAESDGTFSEKYP